jgi:hypothetical protein
MATKTEQFIICDMCEIKIQSEGTSLLLGTISKPFGRRDICSACFHRKLQPSMELLTSIGFDITIYEASNI